MSSTPCLWCIYGKNQLHLLISVYSFTVIVCTYSLYSFSYCYALPGRLDTEKFSVYFLISLDIDNNNNHNNNNNNNNENFIFIFLYIYNSKSRFKKVIYSRLLDILGKIAIIKIHNIYITMQSTTIYKYDMALEFQ